MDVEAAAAAEALGAEEVVAEEAVEVALALEAAPTVLALWPAEDAVAHLGGEAGA